MELEAKAPDLLLEPVWTRAAQPTEYSEITADHSPVVPHYSRFNKLGAGHIWACE